MSAKLVLVTGATGRQGGAVVKYLRQAGVNVRALTRNPASAAAEALKKQGVEVVAGDMDDAASLDRALQGVDGVFSVQNYWEKGVGHAGEVRQARNLADAAKRAGVSHFVQASIADTEKATGVKHFECKAEIERYIDSIGLPRTFIGAVFYMDNFADPKAGKMIFPVISGALRPETKLHLVAVDDIGALVARVFREREKYLGRKVNIAGDRLSVAEMKSVYQQTYGKKPSALKLPGFVINLVNREMARQLSWNNAPGWRFDLDSLRQDVPQMTGFGQYLKQHNLSHL